ncbi:hypothetical protein Tco_1243891 [Tanacetum coccineum]
MADNTKCTPKGIVENLKINKFIFPIDFVILDMVEDIRMPIILRTPLLATTHAKVDIFRKSISLEMGSEKVIFKMRSSFTTTNFKTVRSIKSETFLEEDDFKKFDYDLFLYDSESCEFNLLLCIDPDIFSYEVDIQESYEEIVYKLTEVEKEKYSAPQRVHWCRAILQEKENERQYSTSYYWRERLRDKEDDLEENLEDPEECRKDKANTILGVIHDKLNNDWFNNASEDEDDLEGILDYLKPKSYNGFIDLDNEAYNKRRCRLLGMTYQEPTPVIIEKAKVTRYTVGLGETYTKVKLLGVEKIPRTRDNVAAMRAGNVGSQRKCNRIIGSEMVRTLLPDLRNEKMKEVLVSDLSFHPRFTIHQLDSLCGHMQHIKDAYEAIRQTYLVETDTESEPFEDLETETPESPHIVAPLACHDEESEGSGTSDARSTSSNSTAPLSPDHPLTHATPVLVPSLPRTARMAVRV